MRVGLSERQDHLLRRTRSPERPAMVGGPQHLVVLLNESAIVSGLQEAYTHRVFRTAHYAVFHTGPSATADIEGVLIHRAQAVRSLTVIVDG
jgi:L-lactate utilization protein LutC